MCRRDLYLLMAIAVMALVTPWRAELPRRVAVTVVGSVAYHLSRRKRRDSEQGIERMFGPGMTAGQRDAILKGAFRQFWNDPLASPRSAAGTKDAVFGLSHVHEALAHGRGVILWESSQFGVRMPAKRILRDAGLSVCQVHATSHLGGFGTRGVTSLVREKFIEKFFDRHESHFIAEILLLPSSESVTGRRALLQRLRENRIVCMANDGQFGQKFVSVPFFGRPRPIATGVMTLARVSGAAMLPMFCVEEPRGVWRVVIEPPLRSQHETDRDRAAADVAAQYVALLEAYVRRYPNQYRTWEKLRPRPRDRENSPMESGA